ncbi:multidrug and toxin extrusion protein 1-like [Symsagittifera roscoffensis]|uniref:multidrug and toxin extrusion protein 1-like n=1 Tax=Symsagittifera roscoffensis TaxID=84072 RepID=UPI00307CA068
MVENKERKPFSSVGYRNDYFYQSDIEEGPSDLLGEAENGRHIDESGVVICSGDQYFGMMKEFKVLFLLSLPICLSTFLEQTLFQLVASIFCGHSNEDVYAAFVAALSFGNIVGTAVILGLSAAVDTLFAQYYGGEHFKEMGFVLQKSMLIILPYMMACVGLYLVSDWILIGLHFNEETAVLTGIFLKVYLISLPGEVFSILLGKFLQCQGYVKATVFANIIANAVNALLCYLLIYVWDGGIVGVSFALAISLNTLAFVYFVIIIHFRLHVKTWPGFHWSVVYGWAPYVKLAIPGTVMVVSDMVIFEVGSVLAGILDSHNLSVQGILYEFSTCLFMWGAGVAYAASIRVGNLLGAGDYKTAKQTVLSSLILAFLIVSFFSSLLFIFRNKVAYLIISEEKVATHFAQLVPFLSWCSISDCLVAVCIGILSGCGRQLIGAIGTFVNYYIITLPLSLCLMFLTDLKLQGYWLGLSIGSTIQALILLCAIYRLDWEQEATIAKQRAANDIMNRGDSMPRFSSLNVINPSRAPSAASLARQLHQRSKYHSSFHLSPLSASTTKDIDEDERTVESDAVIQSNDTVSRRIVNSQSFSVSTPELYNQASLEQFTSDDDDDNETDNQSRVVFDDQVDAHSPENETKIISKTFGEDFFARHVPFVSFRCQCLKIVYYFFGFCVLLTGLLISVAFPVKENI